MQLDRVVLLGRTLDEYLRYFQLDLAAWEGKAILDVASGVSSFTAESFGRGFNVTAVDPIYALSPEEIAARCVPDLDYVFKALENLTTYRWSYYKNPEQMRLLREKAYRGFLTDYHAARKTRYVEAALPKLPFENGRFDLTLVSYFLFVYEDHFGYEFHRDALLELLRVTRGEVRIYPIVTFETEPSVHIERLKSDPAFASRQFEVVITDFEFLANSNSYLRIR